MLHKVLSLYFLFSLSAWASWGDAQRAFEQRSGNKRARALINELVASGFYFSAMPLMKEYLISENSDLDRSIETSLSRMISVVGVKQFETLPERYLRRSNSANIKYVLAKKYLRDQKFNQAVALLKQIRRNHPIFPYSQNMMGAIFSIQKQYANASVAFNECIRVSNARMKNNSSRRLILNRDYCVVGLARNKFGEKDYQDADLLYLDLPKSSSVWPEILFEEGWNSYYQKNYNRSLGKLVSYKAPVFEHVFNPEIEVLNALTYLKLCLFQDAKLISNQFYDRYMGDARKLRNYLRGYKSNTNFYFDLMVRYEQSQASPTPLMKTLFNSVAREEVYRDIKAQIRAAANEYRRIKRKPNSRFKRLVVVNLQEAIQSQKRILGAFIRAKLVSHYAQLYRAFEGMSYIKLEVLAQKKAKLYSFDDKNRSRGDVKYIQRNEKQYFWDFNGEFWADELGDYVFALKSEC